ncbi:MAG: MFS transporter [Microthrixaceae bacterium]|nr:MFS transporter [Microthrixaceae bacterium]
MPFSPSSPSGEDRDAAKPHAPRFQPGSTSSALANRAFRWIFLGSFASNIGTWMQNFTLGALADHLTGKAWFIGLVTFAQLGPTLLLSPIAGVVADTFDRKRTMIICASFQAVFSALLAILAMGGDPNETALVGLVFVIGTAGAINAPSAQATMPAIVGRVDLPAAISLSSAQMNTSRVIGPLIAGLLIGVENPSIIFAVNSATYLFVIASVSLVRFDSTPSAEWEPPLARFRSGIAAARADLVVGRVLVTVSLYSLCSLIFIYQMHPFAVRNLGGTSRTFTLVFSAFGLGAALGAISVGTVLARHSRPRMTRIGLVGFGLALGVFSFQTSPTPAYVSAFVTGWCYFVVITSLSTILQERVDDAVRGRVMGLWMLGWAGLVPLGSLIGGPIIDIVGLEWVFLFGAVVALALAAYAKLDFAEDDGPVMPPDVLMVEP